MLMPYERAAGFLVVEPGRIEKFREWVFLSPYDGAVRSIKESS